MESEMTDLFITLFPATVCPYSQSLTQAAFFDASNFLKKAQQQLSGPWPAYRSLYALCWKEPKSKTP